MGYTHRSAIPGSLCREFRCAPPRLGHMTPKSRQVVLVVMGGSGDLPVLADHVVCWLIKESDHRVFNSKGMVGKTSQCCLGETEHYPSGCWICCPAAICWDPGVVLSHNGEI